MNLAQADYYRVFMSNLETKNTLVIVLPLDKDRRLAAHQKQLPWFVKAWLDGETWLGELIGVPKPKKKLTIQWGDDSRSQTDLGSVPVTLKRLVQIFDDGELWHEFTIRSVESLGQATVDSA
jgi:hypothetical protein